MHYPICAENRLRQLAGLADDEHAGRVPPARTPRPPHAVPVERSRGPRLAGYRVDASDERCGERIRHGAKRETVGEHRCQVTKGDAGLGVVAGKSGTIAVSSETSWAAVRDVSGIPPDLALDEGPPATELCVAGAQAASVRRAVTARSDTRMKRRLLNMMLNVAVGKSTEYRERLHRSFLCLIHL